MDVCVDHSWKIPFVRLDVYKIRVVDSTSVARNPWWLGGCCRLCRLNHRYPSLLVGTPLETAPTGGLMECHPRIASRSPRSIVKASGSANAEKMQAFCCVDCSGCVVTRVSPSNVMSHRHRSNQKFKRSQFHKRRENLPGHPVQHSPCTFIKLYVKLR